MYILFSINLKVISNKFSRFFRCLVYMQWGMTLIKCEWNVPALWKILPPVWADDLNSKIVDHKNHVQSQTRPGKKHKAMFHLYIKR